LTANVHAHSSTTTVYLLKGEEKKQIHLQNTFWIRGRNNILIP